jgi:hypothetical protein
MHCCCRLYETVKQINKLEAGMRALSDEQLQVRKQDVGWCCVQHGRGTRLLSGVCMVLCLCHPYR